MSDEIERSLTVAEYEAIHGEGSAEELKKRNLSKFTFLFSHYDSDSSSRCRTCDFPIEKSATFSREHTHWATHCTVCGSILDSLSKRSYWTELEAEANRRRRNAGLSEGAA